MSRKRQPVEPRTASPPGQEIIEIRAGPWAATDGVLKYFAVLAWHDVPHQRLLAFKALDQWRTLSYIRQCRSDIGRNLRKALRPDDGWLEAGTGTGAVHKTFKRLQRCLMAGSSGWALYCNNLPTYGPNPTTQSGTGIGLLRGMASVEQCMSCLTRERFGPEKEIHPEKVSDLGKREMLLRYKDRQSAQRKQSTDNNRRLIWEAFLPVLHHCVTLYIAFERLGNRLSDREKLIMRMHDGSWLLSALDSAEWWRAHLPKRLPFTDAYPFDPGKAIIFKALSDEDLK